MRAVEVGRPHESRNIFKVGIWRIEQAFDVSRSCAGLPPLRVANEPAPDGHLLPCFAATAMPRKLRRDLIEKRGKRSGTDADGTLKSLRNHKAKVFDHALVPCEPTAEDDAARRTFKTQVPKAIPWELPDPRPAHPST